MKHHLGNASSPPLIGLLNLTDPATALANFRMARGQDTVSMGPSPTQPAQTMTAHGSTGGPAIIGISAGLSFLLGASLVVVMMLCLRKRRQAIEGRTRRGLPRATKDAEEEKETLV